MIGNGGMSRRFPLHAKLSRWLALLIVACSLAACSARGVLSMRRTALRWMTSILIFGISMSADAGLFEQFGGKSWKEEVVLHDGKMIVVERIQNLGKRPTLESREGRILDETITFSLPETHQQVIWTMSFRDDVPEPNGINVIALDIVDNVAYIGGYPAGCIAYNKWKRPNPPQILFKYEDGLWKRVALAEFPPQITRANVIVGGPPTEGINAFYTVKQVNEKNHGIDTPEYKTILRESLAAGQLCPRYSSGPKAPTPITPKATSK